MRNRLLARVAIASAIVLSGLSAADAARRPAKTAQAKVEMTDRECMARAMYFESNRNREDGMLAVGTIVANRLESGRYASTICGVVSQRSQFAPGVLSRRMTEARPAEKARRVAEAVLNGLRHPVAGDAMFFHTANVPFRNDDKAYVLVSGGNAFYRWNRGGDDEAERANLGTFSRAFETADEDRRVGLRVVVKAVPQNPDDAPVLRVATLVAPDAVTTAEPQQISSAQPDLAAETRPQLITVAARDAVPQTEPKVAQEIVDPPSALSKALAFRGEPSRTPAANDALAAVLALAPRPSAKQQTIRRVISPAAPVYASSAPLFRPRGAPEPNPMANIVVAQAWSDFE